MKKNICILLILISYISCSNGQSKVNTNNAKELSKEILGCWRVVDTDHDIKSNYPHIDSLCLENRRLYVASEIKEPSIMKFFEDNTVRFYLVNGEQIEETSYYEIKKDSLSIEDFNPIRPDTKSTYKITISNDTLYLETDILGEVKTDVGNFVLSHKADLKILKDIKIEVAKRYAIFIRVPDCDQYKE